MKVKFFAAASLSLAIMAGCAVVPTAAPLEEKEGVIPNPTSYRYSLTGERGGHQPPVPPVETPQGNTQRLSIIGVDASPSIDERYFSEGNLIDGNLHSAWIPLPSTINPAAEFQLAETATVTQMAIKLSHSPGFGPQRGPAEPPFEVTVQFSDDGFTFDEQVRVPISVYGELTRVNLPPTDARFVRLFFDGYRISVCEVQFFGETAQGNRDCIVAETEGTLVNPGSGRSVSFNVRAVRTATGTFGGVLITDERTGIDYTGEVNSIGGDNESVVIMGNLQGGGRFILRSVLTTLRPFPEGTAFSGEVNRVIVLNATGEDILNVESNEIGVNTPDISGRRGTCTEFFPF